MICFNKFNRHFPNLIVSLGLTVLKSVDLTDYVPAVANIPKVNFVPYTGTLICFKT